METSTLLPGVPICAEIFLPLKSMLQEFNIPYFFTAGKVDSYSCQCSASPENLGSRSNS